MRPNLSRTAGSAGGLLWYSLILRARARGQRLLQPLIQIAVLLHIHE